MIRKLDKLKRLLDIGDEYVGLVGLTDRNENEEFVIKNNDDFEFLEKKDKKIKKVDTFKVSIKNKINDSIPPPNPFLPSIPFAIYINGVVKAGKSVFARSLIDLYIDAFDKILLISPNFDTDASSIMLLDAYPQIEPHRSLQVLNNVVSKLKIHNKGKTDIKDKFMVLIIMDDVINEIMELGNKKSKNFMNEIAISRRHIGISFLMLSQYYKRIHPIFRVNFNSFVLFRQENQTERKKIVEELSGYLGTDLFEEIFDEATREPHSALTINFTADDKKFIYTQNFNKILIENPDEHSKFNLQG